jgi:hypothetical protein
VSEERPDTADLEREAREAIDGYRTYLASPAFQHQLDIAVLVKIAGDEAVDVRERRRAAEALAKLRLDAMGALASLTAAREHRLDALGLKTGPQSLALTQVNQKIEIVRAKDWRNAPALGDAVDVEAEVLPPPSANGHAANGHAGNGQARNGDGADPPP